MPATTAQDIIVNAFNVLGVYAPGETLSASDANGAYNRLNRMLQGWSLQPLTIPVIAREVFGVTANVGTYTIGPGGDFDTSRPTSLEGVAILLNSGSTTATVSSLTSAGTLATATVATHGYSSGQNVTIAGASPAAYNGTFPITVLDANTFTYEFGGGTSPATGTITALPEQTGNSVVEVARALLTDDGWQAIRIKSLTAAQFTDVYYNETFFGDLGTISLWPIPTTAANSLVLYRKQQLASFTSLSATYQLPPGAEDAIEYNLARRLLTVYGITDQGIASDVIAMANSTLATYKRGNVELTDLPTDPALTRDPSGGYNILTGTGGNTGG